MASPGTGPADLHPEAGEDDLDKSACCSNTSGDALRCPTEPVSMKGKPKLEEETWFSIPTDGKKVLPGEDMANPALLPETLMSDPFPTEDRFEVETLKPDSETSFDSTTDQTNRLPAKYMTNHALLPDSEFTPKKSTSKPESETLFGSTPDQTNYLPVEVMAHPALLPDALRSDQCPSEPVSVKGKPKLEDKTCVGVPNDGRKVLPGEDMANPALLPETLTSDHSPTEDLLFSLEVETLKPEGETAFGSTTNPLPAQDIANPSLPPDAVRSDQCPTEPVIVKEKPKLVRETCLTNEKKRLSAEDMTNPALLPGTALMPVLTKVEVQSLKDIRPGDHITILDNFSKQSHEIVYSIEPKKNAFTAFACKGSKEIVLKTDKFKLVGRIHRIDYECKRQHSHEESLEEAKQMFGDKPRPLSWFQRLRMVEEDTAKPPPPITDSSKSATAKEKHAANLPPPYTHSSKFATKAKIGYPLSLHKECVFDSSKQREPVSCTEITGQVTVAAGDHIVTKSQEGEWQSLLVKDRSGNSIATLQPVLDDNGKIQLQEDILVLSDQELYRVNYLQTLPPGTVVERARSPEGQDMLEECKECPDCFIAWAIMGRKVATHMEKLKEKLQIEDRNPTHTEKIYSVSSIKVGDHLIQRATVPVTYWHYMVTEALPDEGKFKVITGCIALFDKKETEITIDLEKSPTPFYKVVYPESLTPTQAVKRARSMLKSEISLAELIQSQWENPGSDGCSNLESQKFSPVQLIRWAKTGSDKGLEADLLVPSSLPLTKSRICSAAQLNVGDYVTLKQTKLDWTHHYLITKIHSPNEFSGIEYFRLKVREVCVPLPEDCSDGYPACYRVNYAEATCVTPKCAISKARNKSTNLSVLHVPPTTKVRERFVHYVKTGECAGIDIHSLEDERHFLRREKIESARELFVGDHIERPICGVFGRMRKAYHHMLVAEQSVRDQSIMVIHYSSIRSYDTTTRFERLKNRVIDKEEVKEEVTDIFVMGEVFRIKYPDRVPPMDGIAWLREEAQNAKKNYHVTKHNCENLVMTATINRSMSIQVDDVVRKLITYTRNAVRPVGIATGASAFKASQKGATKAALMAGTAKHAAVSGRSAAKGVSKPAAKGAHAAQSTGFRIGYDTSISAASLGAAAGVSAFVAIPTEAAVAIYFSLKHRQKREHGLISNDELIKEFTKEQIIAVNTAALSIAGAVVGTAAIPVPVLGASVGGFFGCLAGQALGHAEGKLFDLLYEYWLGGDVDLPPVCNHVFFDCPTPDKADL